MSQFPQVVACQNDLEECIRNNLPQIASILSFIGLIVPVIQYMYFDYKSNRFTEEFRRHFLMVLSLAYFILLTFPGVALAGLLYSTCDATYNVFTYIFALICAACSCVQWVP